MNSVVTGASGFLGSRLVTRLAASGGRVTAIARRPAPVELQAATAIRWIQRDILQDGLSAGDVQDCDVVFHLAAAKTIEQGQDERSLVEANEQLTIEVLRATAGIAATFVHASTQMVYGDAGSIAVSEDHPLLVPSFTPYGCSKANAEKWLECLHARHGAKFIVLRFCGFVEGGGNIDYMIERAVRHEPIVLLARGATRRDYLTANAGIDALLAAARYARENEAAPFEVLNIGSGDAVPATDLARAVCSALGSRSEIVLSDAPAPLKDLVLDITRAKRRLTFRPEPQLDVVRRYAIEHARTLSSMVTHA